jgi:hypothetical protein
MIGELKLEGGNIANLILLGIIIALGVYVYIELRNIKREIALLKRPPVSGPSGSSSGPLAPGSGPPGSGPPGSGPPGSSSGPLAPISGPPDPVKNMPTFRPLPMDSIPFNLSELKNQEPSLQEPPLEYPPLQEPPLEDPPLQEPPIQEPPLEEDDSILDLRKIMESDGGVMGPIGDVTEDKDDTVIESLIEDKDIRLISADSPESKYQGMTVSELKEILLKHELPLSGNKTKLIKRIQEHVVISKV